MKANAHYYHCATKGFDHCILFENDWEFIAGMNRIGICTVRLQEESPVTVLAFCLMDNHIHLILHGTKEACLRWMSSYHRLTTRWLANQQDGRRIDEQWEYDAWPIRDAEDLKQKIAYVFRNPTVARMPFVPNSYPWSSANLVFSGGTQRISGRRVGSMSVYESRKVFGTRLILPPDWIVLPDGLIWPGCYTNTAQVEKIYEHPRCFLFYLNQNLETTINQEMYGKHLSLPDKDVTKIAHAVADNQFGTQDIELLDLPRRIQLCTLLKKQTGASLKQLSRITHLPLDDLKKIFG